MLYNKGDSDIILKAVVLIAVLWTVSFHGTHTWNLPVLLHMGINICMCIDLIPDSL